MGEARLTVSSDTRSAAFRESAEADHASVISLIQELVQIPTRGGIDPYEQVVDLILKRFSAIGLDARYLHDEGSGRVVAVVCDVAGRHAGPRYVLDACIDTAPFGDPQEWRHDPTSGVIEDGWLHGRGAADSKAAIAIFMHLAAHIQEQSSTLRGSLTLLFDADVHTGHFGGAKRYFEAEDTPRDIDGVMIGYPGSEK